MTHRKRSIDDVMTAVWALVRSGPNFDGRDADVERAVAAAIDAAVAAEREQHATDLSAALGWPHGISHGPLEWAELCARVAHKNNERS